MQIEMICGEASLVFFPAFGQAFTIQRYTTCQMDV